MLLSLIKIDFVLNLFFMSTSIYFTYNEDDTKYWIAQDIIFFLLILCSAMYAFRAITQKNEKAYFRLSLLRVGLELIKIVKCILILNGINASYTYSEKMLQTLGNLKFSILVQEIISLALFIPILSLGRFIFFGFSINKFDEIFDLCISLHVNQTEQIVKQAIYKAYQRIKEEI